MDDNFANQVADSQNKLSQERRALLQALGFPNSAGEAAKTAYRICAHGVPFRHVEVTSEIVRKTAWEAAALAAVQFTALKGYCPEVLPIATPRITFTDYVRMSMAVFDPDPNRIVDPFKEE